MAFLGIVLVWEGWSTVVAASSSCSVCLRFFLVVSDLDPICTRFQGEASSSSLMCFRFFDALSECDAVTDGWEATGTGLL